MDNNSIPEDFVEETAAPSDQAQSNEAPQAAALDSIPEGFVPEETQNLSELPPGFVVEGGNQDYSTPGQSYLAGVEGMAKGIAGPVATGMEWLGSKTRTGALLKDIGIDLSPEAQAGRAEANPEISHGAEAAGLVGGAFTGSGEIAALNNVVSKLPEATSVLGKIGSAFIKNAIVGGAVQTGDELSKAMLGQGDPEHPVASALVNIGGAGLLSAGTGALFNAAGQGIGRGLQAIDNSKLGPMANKVLIGLGISHALQQAGTEVNEGTVNNALRSMGLFNEGEVDYNSLKSGINAYDRSQHIMRGMGARLLGKAAGAMAGGVGGYPGTVAGMALEKVLEPVMDKMVGKGVGIAGKAVFPAVLRAASEGSTEGLSTVMQYAKDVSKGNTLMNKAVDSLFVPGQQMINADSDEKGNNKLRKSIENGDLLKQIQGQDTEQQPPGYAKGGQVQSQNEPNHIAMVFPEQNMLLNAAKGRVYNYLNSMRPIPPAGQLPFDTVHKNHTQERHYDSAINIANSPLSVMNHIKDGSITPDQINHLNQMYPEVYRQLAKKITKQITDKQIDQEKIPYKVRQSLSMFLAAPLDSTFTPGNIQAIQATFAPKQQPGPQGPQKQAQGKAKKGTATLGKSNKEYLTPNQSAEADASKRD